MRDFRKGGVTPENFSSIIETINSLSNFSNLTTNNCLELSKFNLTDISDEDQKIIITEIFRRALEKSKQCWHPLASKTECDLDESGNLKVTAAHSIQNNGILSKISENGHVMTYEVEKGSYIGKNTGKRLASIFWGFCNTHDAIFTPIEVQKYICTVEQNFLFAYRAFLVTAHKKLEGSYLINYGTQSENDIHENRKIFDKAILSNDFDILETVVIELPAFYPIATSSSFYLDFDFEGTTIQHSEERMENIFISFFPNETKSYFLLSYFKIDRHLYAKIGEQLIRRNNLKSDITMLIGAHVENVYFNPIYYRTFIEQHEKSLHKLLKETQEDFVYFDPQTKEKVIKSMTPNNYMTNIYEINFFGY